MHKYEGRSIRNTATATGALSKSVGFNAPTDGQVRKLTAREKAGQLRAIAGWQKAGVN